MVQMGNLMVIMIVGKPFLVWFIINQRVHCDHLLYIMVPIQH
ncbi:hypothetical protein PAEVO_63750 [Paenibacillus sp. GM2FR]|nr:hypothetical protein PAEVO_63750 [Paenibacillus sp. GM2FR]